MFFKRSVFLCLLASALTVQSYAMEDRSIDRAATILQIKKATVLFNQQNRADITPLMYCVCNAPLNQYCCYFLSDINTQDENGFTALMMAVKVGNQPLVSSLLENNASIFLRDNTGRNALDWATFFNRRPIIELLKQSAAQKINYQVGQATTGFNQAKQTRDQFDTFVAIALANNGDEEVEVGNITNVNSIAPTPGSAFHDCPFIGCNFRTDDSRGMSAHMASHDN